MCYFVQFKLKNKRKKTPTKYLLYFRNTEYHLCPAAKHCDVKEVGLHWFLWLCFFQFQYIFRFSRGMDLDSCFIESENHRIVLMRRDLHKLSSPTHLQWTGTSSTWSGCTRSFRPPQPASHYNTHYHKLVCLNMATVSSNNYISFRLSFSLSMMEKYVS